MGLFLSEKEKYFLRMYLNDEVFIDCCMLDEMSQGGIDSNFHKS